jgi:hypothetical protein
MINYKETTEVKEAFEKYNAFPENDERRIHFLFAEGKEVVLEVKVTDSQLFRLTCLSMFTSNSPLSVPGAEITSISLDTNGKDKVIKFLEEQLHNLKKL